MDNWCAHYDGLCGFGKPREKCRAAVRYQDVCDDTRKGLERYPCFEPQTNPVPCPCRRWKTPQEKADEREEIQRSVNQIKDRIDNGLCVQCGEPCTMRASRRSRGAKP